MKTNDIKEKIGMKLIEMIEGLDEPIWRKPWVFASPEKAFGGFEYIGVNQVMTSLYRIANGYKSHLWLTRKKIDELSGWKWDPQKKRKVRDRNVVNDVYLRAGSHGVPVIYWNFISKKDENGNIVKDKNGDPVTFPVIRSYYVFNSDDVIGFDFSGYEPELKPMCDILSCEGYESLMLSTYKSHPRVRHGGNRACYSPSTDIVTVPEMEQFTSSVEYAATLAHELGHSTGHKSRLNRKMDNRFGDDNYSFEELIAEFTSSMVLAKMSIMDHPLENSAAYIKNWMDHIKNNPISIYDAISNAKKACDMIMGEKYDAKNQGAF